jgi:hypothetical protein
MNKTTVKILKEMREQFVQEIDHKQAVIWAIDNVIDSMRKVDKITEHRCQGDEVDLMRALKKPRKTSKTKKLKR